ncbi:hypothetical protein [uncultured Kordia sp.]|uniref:hypothetical protein n=1 Tax=uncultured Kordia sp. TaxID=507699 RepID=UPI00261111AC|nr:hypothetical protein [uncultured Kordia sp.]
MKKRNLKSLKLNKKVVSKLETSIALVGGANAIQSIPPTKCPWMCKVKKEDPLNNNPQS